MSLAIDANNVGGVLLADGWHIVSGKSFELDSYEFLDGTLEQNGYVLHGGGQSGICATGFRFLDAEDGWVVAGPLSSIVAVRIR